MHDDGGRGEQARRDGGAFGRGVRTSTGNRGAARRARRHCARAQTGSRHPRAHGPPLFRPGREPRREPRTSTYAELLGHGVLPRAPTGFGLTGALASRIQHRVYQAESGRDDGSKLTAKARNIYLHDDPALTVSRVQENPIHLFAVDFDFAFSHRLLGQAYRPCTDVEAKRHNVPGVAYRGLDSQNITVIFRRFRGRAQHFNEIQILWNVHDVICHSPSLRQGSSW